MAYIYGPVPSRRLGVSLGVDLTPGRVCTLDCIYCEEARPTAVLTTVRGEYAPTQQVISEITQAATTMGGKLNYLTFPVPVSLPSTAG